jgi:putative FmdB family regulatory protein
MPIYEFRCAQCQTVFEELVRMGQTGEGMTCPHCGARNISKLMSACFSRTASPVSSCDYADMCGAAQGQTPACCGGNCAGHRH